MELTGPSGTHRERWREVGGPLVAVISQATDVTFSHRTVLLLIMKLQFYDMKKGGGSFK